MRMKVCFDCNTSCVIDSNNYASLLEEGVFNNTHRGHRIQVISYEEYAKWKKQNKKMMW